MNKKVLSTAKRNLDKAKAPAKPRDVVYTSRGQLDFPGLETKVPTPDGSITMNGVPFPVYGVDNTGFAQMMYPDNDYQFPGDVVHEYPQVAKKGGTKNSSKYSRSLTATNRLFVKNFLHKKHKHKIFDPNAPFYQDGGEPEDYQAFLDYSKTAPENRQPSECYYYMSPDEYDHYGMWETLGKPQNFEQALEMNPDWQPDEEGYYHGYSVNPYTGVFLKSGAPGLEEGDTKWMEIKDHYLSPRSNTSTPVYDPELQRFKYIPKEEDGGIIVDLTDDEIQTYRDGGYIVEDISIPTLNHFQDGGEETDPPADGIAQRVQYAEGQTPEGFAEGMPIYSEVTKKAEAPYWLEASREYESKNSKQAFIDEKKKEYLKGTNQGLLKAQGYNMENFPEDVERNFEKAYEYKKNTYVAKKLGKKFGFSPRRRGEWVDYLSKGERNVFANSKFESKLQPSLWDRTLAGLVTLTTPFDARANDAMNRGELPGLTKKEQKEIKDAELFGVPVGGLEALAGWDALGVAAANALEKSGNSGYGASYREAPSALSGQPMANVKPEQIAALNLLNYTLPYDMAAAAPSIIKGVGNVARTTGKVLTEATPLKNAYKINPLANKEVPLNTLYHGSENPNLQFNDIILTDVNPNVGSRPGQFKKRAISTGDPLELPGGFYTNDKSMPGFMGNNSYRYSMDIPANANVFEWKSGISDNISVKKLQELKNKGYDIIKGKNILGETEYIPLNKDIISNWKKFEKGAPELKATQNVRFETQTPHWLQGYKKVKPPKKLSESSKELAGFSDTKNLQGANVLKQIKAVPVESGIKRTLSNITNTAKEAGKDIMYQINNYSNIKNTPKIYKEEVAKLLTEKGKERLKGLGVEDMDDFMNYINRGKSYTTRGAGTWAGEMADYKNVSYPSINIDFEQLNKLKGSEKLSDKEIKFIVGHELGHNIQSYLESIGKTYKGKSYLDIEAVDELAPFIKEKPKEYLEKSRMMNDAEAENLATKLGDDDGEILNASYFFRGSKGNEPLPHLRELKQRMLNKGIINSIHDEITAKDIGNFYINHKGYKDRILSFVKPGDDSYKTLAKLLNKTPVVIPAAIGVGALQQKENGGEIIVDDLSEDQLQNYLDGGYIIERID